MKKEIPKIIIVIIIVISIFTLDQFTKSLIEKRLELGESYIIIKDFFKLTYVRNTGAAFSILSGKVNLLILTTWGILFYLIYEMYLGFKKFLLPYFFSILIGGLLGNLYDRVILGYVRDFLDFKIFNYDFAIFNVSDMFLVIGTFLLIILFLTKGDVYENNSKKRRSK